MREPTLTELILWRAEERAPRPAISWARAGARQSLSWGELATQVGDLLVGFDSLELRPGDVVGILAPNRWEWTALDLALMGRGAVVLPIDPAWSERRMTRILTHASVRVVCTDDEAAARRLLDAALPDLRAVVLIDPFREPVRGALELETIRREGQAVRRARPSLLVERMAAVRPDDVATIIHTGGSTGEPKGVIRTHRNTASRGWALFPWEGDPTDPPGDEDLLLDPLSFCHSAGRWWCHTALATGRMVAFTSTGTEALSLDELQLLRPTHLATVPRVVLSLQKLLAPHVEGLSDDGAFRERLRSLVGGRLRRICWGGGPLIPSAKAFFEDRGGIALACGYGGTEAGIVAIQDDVRRFGTAGQPHGAAVRISDGEILVRGPGVSPGYFANPEATARARVAGGWWRTGDLGRFDELGNLVILGRANAMFTCNEGTNIDPVELEQLLESEPLIREAILVGNRRPYLAALLVLDRERLAADAPGADGGAVQELIAGRIARMNEALEAYEQVRRFAVVEAFPPTVRQVTIANKIRIDREAVEQTFRAEIEALYSNA